MERHVGALILALVLVLQVGVVAAGAVRVGSAGETAPAVVEAGSPRLTRDGARRLLDGAPLTGRIEERAEAGGRLLRTTPYVGGLREGTERAWYPDGAPAGQRTWRLGRREGAYVAWYPGGALRTTAHYRADVYEGQVRDWYPDGTLRQDARYVAGHEAGPQRLWARDGTLRASYVVRDGRRYGLLGTKPCRTPSDSLVNGPDEP